MPQPDRERLRVGRIDLQRAGRHALDGQDRAVQHGRLVDSRHTAVHVENRRAVRRLLHGFPHDIGDVARLERLLQEFLAGRVDALADDEPGVGREFDDGSAGRNARPFRGEGAVRVLVPDGRHGAGDVGGGRAAAAAHDFHPGVHERGDIRGEFIRSDGEDGFAVHEFGHAGVGLDDERFAGDGGEAFDVGEHAVGAEAAVQPVGVDAQALQQGCDALDRAARQEFAVLAQGDGRPDRQIAVLLGGEHGGLEFARVAHRLDENEVCAGRGARPDHFGERGVGVFEGEFARRREEPSGRADVQRDFRAAFPGN